MTRRRVQVTGRPATIRGAQNRKGPGETRGLSASTAGDGRVSAWSRGGDRVDVCTIPENGGAEVQVTSKATTGSPHNFNPVYSPDGQSLPYFACPSVASAMQDCALYRIKADGSGKAIKIAGGRNQNWRRHFWVR